MSDEEVAKFHLGVSEVGGEDVITAKDPIFVGGAIVLILWAVYLLQSAIFGRRKK